MTRIELIETIANRLITQTTLHPLRVAIDGVDAAGKTTLAGELALYLQGQGRSIIRASVDGFHNPREIRYRRGMTSPQGYYFDSYDYPALKKLLLEPLGPGGNLAYHTAIFDYRTNATATEDFHRAPNDAILLFDRIFLLRPELHNFWDFKIFVEINPDTSLLRGTKRDKDYFGSLETARERYVARYLPGQKLYLAEANPRSNCDLLIDNNNLENPNLIVKS